MNEVVTYPEDRRVVIPGDNFPWPRAAGSEF